MAATYYEVHGWPVVRWDQGECDCERRLACFWEDLLDVLYDLDTNPGWPWQDYPHGAADGLIRTATVRGIGKSESALLSATQAYKWAIIDCRYSTRGPKWNPNYGYIEEQLINAGQAFAVDVTNLRWKSDSTTVKAGDAPILDRDLLHYRVNFINIIALPSWVLTRQGVCNSNVFTTATLMVGTPFTPLSFAVETLKYCGIAVRGKYSLGYLPRYSLTVDFEFRDVGWNKHWRHDTFAYETLKTTTGSDYIQHTPVVMDLV